VILVDSNDNEIGVMEKMEAHSKGMLHRAFSVFIFNSKGELLLQKRASSKYHSKDLWTNTCCSHPAPNDKIENSVHERLKFEMGIDAPLKELFSFTYKSELGNDLTEHEFDHIFVGVTDEKPKLNSEEASESKWVDLITLKKDVQQNADQYTSWFKLLISQYVDKFEQYLENESLPKRDI